MSPDDIVDKTSTGTNVPDIFGADTSPGEGLSAVGKKTSGEPLPTLAEVAPGVFESLTCMQCKDVPSTHRCLVSDPLSGKYMYNGSPVCGSVVCSICMSMVGMENTCHCLHHQGKGGTVPSNDTGVSIAGVGGLSKGSEDRKSLSNIPTDNGTLSKQMTHDGSVIMMVQSYQQNVRMENHYPKDLTMM